MLDWRKVDQDTVNPLLRLSVFPHQDANVAPNSVTIAQASVEPGATVWGLWAGETPVGLLAYIDVALSPSCQADGDDPTALYVWRLMIDKDHQRNGYGAATMARVADVAAEIGRSRVLVSAAQGDHSPVPFYEKLGYARTGRIVDEEIMLERVL